MRLPGERRRALAARVAGAAHWREPVSPAAQFQADRRHHSPPIRRCVPAAARQERPARQEVGDRRDAGCGLRIEQPTVRTGRPEARHDAVHLSERRRRRAQSDSRLSSRPSAGCSLRPHRAVCVSCRWGDRRRNFNARSNVSIRAPRSRGIPADWRDGRDRCSTILPDAFRGSTCPSTSRRRRSSGRSGRRSRRFHTDRREPMPMWRLRLGAPARRGRSRGPARRIRSRWRFRVTASSPPQEASAAIGGAGARRKRAIPRAILAHRSIDETRRARPPPEAASASRACRTNIPCS